MKKPKKLTEAERRIANGYSKVIDAARKSIDQGEDTFSSRAAKVLKCKRLLHNI